jgi:hypothetical protein
VKSGFSISIRIVNACSGLSAGEGFANAQGLMAKAGGIINWSEVVAARHLETRKGSLVGTAVVGGAIGMLGGPPGAAIGAAAGALLSLTASVDAIVLRLGDGADLMIEVPTRHSKTIMKLSQNIQPAKSRLRLLLTKRD